MHDADRDLLVLNGEVGGDLGERPAAGSAAVFQGMLAMLAEELGQLRSDMRAIRGVVETTQVDDERLARVVARQVDQSVARHLDDLARAVAAAPAPGPSDEVLALVPAVTALEARMIGLEDTVAAGTAQIADRAEQIGRVGDAVAGLHDAVNRSRGETVAALNGLAPSLAEQLVAAQEALGAQVSDALAGLEGDLPAAVAAAAGPLEEAASALVAVPAKLHDTMGALVGPLCERLAALGPALDGLDAVAPAAARSVVEHVLPAVEDVTARVERLEESLGRLHEQADLRATQLASDLSSSLNAGVERLVVRAAATDDQVGAELRSLRARLDAVDAGVAALAAELATVSDATRRVADEGRVRPVLEAIDAAARDSGEALAAVHSSLAKRLEARTRTLSDLLDSVSAPLGAAAAVGPTLERLAVALAEQRGVLEQLAGSVTSVATGLGDVQAAVTGDDGTEKTVEAVAGLHAALERSLESVRAYLGEGLVHVSRRQAAATRAVESAGASVAAMESQLKSITTLCQSLAAGVEQQGQATSRVGDLLLETRSALRSDVERLEGAVHLEAVKLHQQDHARLAGVTAATTEVIEREAGLLTQRVSAISGALDAVRALLHGRAGVAGVASAARAGEDA